MCPTIVGDFIKEYVVGDSDEKRQAPANKEEAADSLFVIVERVNEEQLEVGSLTQHPEIGGEGGVSCQDIDGHAPAQTALDEVEYKQIVEEPRNITANEPIKIQSKPTPSMATILPS